MSRSFYIRTPTTSCRYFSTVAKVEYLPINDFSLESLSIGTIAPPLSHQRFNQDIPLITNTIGKFVHERVPTPLRRIPVDVDRFL